MKYKITKKKRMKYKIIYNIVINIIVFVFEGMINIIVVTRGGRVLSRLDYREKRGKGSMALRCSSAAAVAIFKSSVSLKSHIFPISVSFQNLNSHSNSSTIFCTATKSQKSSPPPPPSSSKKKTKKKKNTSVESDDWKNLNSNTDFELFRDFSADNDVQNVVTGVASGSSLFYPDDMPLPEPPTGFAIDENGELLLTLTNRLITIVSTALFCFLCSLLHSFE